MQDHQPLSISAKEIILYFLIPGIIQGASFWYLIDYGFDHKQNVLFQALMFFCAAAPTAFFLTTRKDFRLKPFIFAIILGSVTALLYFLAIRSFGVAGMDEPNETILQVSWLSNLLICYIAVPFFRTVFERREAPNHYPSLFQFAWNLPVILLIACLFIAALWIVLWLWISLFDVIGVDFFKDLFTEPLIGWGISGGAFATAIAIARAREGIVLAMRGILFALLRILMPILALATLLFVVTALMRGPQNIDVGNWSLAGTMVWAVVIAVLLISAVAGDEGEPGLPLLRWAIRLQSLVLPLLAGLAVWALWIRIAEYGISVHRFYAGIIICFALAYALIYAISAFLPRGLPFLRQMNITLAGALFITAIAIQLPMVNPWQMTADSILSRIKSGEMKTTEIDWPYLQFELGRPGHDLLDRLVADTTLDNHAVILTQIERVRASESKWDYNRGGSTETREDNLRLALAEGKIDLWPEESTLPDSLVIFFARDNSQVRDLTSCLSASECRAVLVNLGTADTPKWLLATNRYGNSVTLRLLWQQDETWRSRRLPSRTFSRDDEGPAAKDAFMSGLAEGAFDQGTIEIETLTVGETRILLFPETQDEDVLDSFVAPQKVE